MYKQLFIVIFATRFVVCGLIDVELPDGKKVTITRPNGTLDLVSLKSVGQEIRGKIDPQHPEAEYGFMQIVADFLSTTITDLRLIQAILAAVDLQIGEIKSIQKSIQKEPREERVIENIVTNIVTYYDYHFIYKNILGLLKCGCEEQTITLHGRLKQMYIAFTFIGKTYNIHLNLPYHIPRNLPSHAKLRENQDIEWLLKSKNYIRYFDSQDSKDYPDTLLLNLKLNHSTSHSTSVVRKAAKESSRVTIENNNKSTYDLDPANTYPVLETVALIIKAAELVEETDQEAFIRQFKENLKSFKHPNIILSFNYNSQKSQ